MTNPLSMSDEDFLKQNPPEMGGSQEEPVADDNKAAEEANPVVEEPVQEEKPADTSEENKSSEEAKPENNQEENPDNKDDKKDGEEKPEDQNKSDSSGSEEKKPDGEEQQEQKSAEEAPNYQEMYTKIMAPFKANGKTIELKSPEEAIQLMQMGANYTRKLQELAPSRKLVTMLNNHSIDENKLSFLIDLDKKDPEAIKKLIKDSGIDPMDIDTSVEPAYREGSHQVSDQEVAFRTTLDELVSTQSGQELVQEINAWDQTSKDLLWQHPEVMSILRTQRDAGIYQLITEEMDRQKTLGQLSPTTSFLEGYKIVGDQLTAAGKFDNPGGKQETQDNGTVPPKADPEPVVVRAAAPKPPVDNDDKAGAASPSRAAPGKAQETTNFLAMSDEDFLKSEAFRGRV